MSTSTQSQTQSSNTVDQNQTNGSSSNAGDLSGVHPSAVGSHNMPDATKTQPPNDRSTDKDNVDQDHLDSQYPEQKHAGAVGYGPNYNQKAGFLDKVTGLKEEFKGKVTKNPDLAAKGHDRMTGELKHKELEEEDVRPFVYDLFSR
ncbi:hypothetical protein B0H11DRAFT_1729718 [Mycena galericulata]|nr:hypothetical protein B0H11DRAFT_1729718 [Mycena galericulata]